ncbi:MAG: fibronectin type III domain-containing protein [Treponema sp.]
MKINKFLRTSAAILAAAALGFTAMSCEQLQGLLSSEQQEAMTEATGTASLAGSSWYYNGASTTDMSAVTNETLCINFSQPAALSDDGLSGKFTVSYKDENNVTSSKEFNLNGGSFNSEGTAYYLSMTPIMSLLDGASTYDGTLAVQIKAGGFICNEGDQKGRSIDTLKINISVAPLYSATTLKGVTFSTVYNTLGNNASVLLSGKASLSSDASFAVEFTNAPAGFTKDNLSLSMNDDGTAILITPNVDLYGQDFSAKVTVAGIIPSLTETSVSQSFNIDFAPDLITVDGTKDDNWSSGSKAEDAAADGSAGGWAQSGIDATNLYVTSDANNLYVAVEGTLGINWNDGLILMMDKVASDDSNIEDVVAATLLTTLSTNYVPYPAATTAFTNGEPDIYFWHKPGYNDNAGDGAGVLYAKSTGATDWAQVTSFWGATPDSSVMSASPKGWTKEAPATFVEYSFDLASLGLASGEKVRVYAVLSSNWTTIYSTDSVPDATVTTDHSNATFDFANALSYTVGSSSGEIKAYAPSAPTSVTASAATYYTITLSWPAVYNTDTYTVSRAPTQDGTYEDIATGLTDLTYEDTGLTVGTTYYYKVSAVNTTGSSASSAYALSTKPAPTSLEAATVAATHASATSVNVSWTSVTDAESYSVSYSTTSDGTYTDASTTETGTSYTVTGLTAATTYYFKVTAANATFSITGTSSEAVSAITYPAITLDGTLEDAWKNTDLATTSDSSYSESNTYQNMTNLYITNDETNVYVAIVYGTAAANQGNDVHANLLFDTAATSEKTSETNVWGSPATTSTYSNDGLNYEAYEFITYNHDVSNCTCSEVPSWVSSELGYQYASTVVEYSIPIASLGAVGDTLKLFASISQYAWTTENTETLLDCIPNVAATIADSGATLTVDFSNALSYTIK